jgi:FkbM family methyltransferase
VVLPSYEHMLEAFYRAVLRPGDGVIDVGAHNGRHSLPCAVSVGPTGRIFGFEPLPIQHKNLAALISAEQAAGQAMAPITLFNCALGDIEGTTDFTIVTDFPEYSGFQQRQYHAENLHREIIQVQVKTLDAMRAEFGKIRYIKIDAEGGELMILRGASALITEQRPIISFELGDASLLNYPYTAGDYYDFFASHDYRIYSIFGLELNRDAFVKFSAMQFFWDYIAVPATEAWPGGHDPLRVMIAQLADAIHKDAAPVAITAPPVLPDPAPPQTALVQAAAVQMTPGQTETRSFLRRMFGRR